MKLEQMVAVQAIFAQAVAQEVAYFELVSVVEAGENTLALNLTSTELPCLR